ncbi:MAG: sigma-54-dependent Fis family transcriptional regulator [Nitrospirae bacterium]|nr:sigma-54-dependent Fis family transcriptional regulator [Nitrospirota bacterium]
MDKILIVDDERNILRMMNRFLTKEGFYVETARNFEEATSRFADGGFNLVLTDMRLPGRSGLEILKWIKQKNPEIPVIIITAHGSIENAVEAMKSGAANYLTKPVDLEEMLAIVRHTLLHSQGLTEETLSIHREQQYGIIGKSKAIQDILATIEVVSNSRANILISGESGTGKELVARAIHKASSRKEFPFVAINCAAIPPDLIENELFGHEAGAYTGALGQEKGKVEVADRGTLFLDEIGEMAVNMQIKLLRFIQEREFYRIGGTRPVRSDCRIIAATNKDLEKEVAAGRFREDLFYRLNVIPIKMPPLRERKEDIPLLVDYFLRKYAEENHKFINAVEQRVMDALLKYSWPGNIRELENIIERAVVLTKFETIVLDDLPRKIASLVLEDTDSPGRQIKDLSDMTLSEIERLAIINALEAEDWNQTRAARRLGITRRQLRTKMVKYKLL